LLPASVTPSGISALKYHTATRAAILQLSVPALAAFGGVIFLAETVSLRLVGDDFDSRRYSMAIAGRKYDKNKA
jgi:hypothetical protein